MWCFNVALYDECVFTVAVIFVIEIEYSNLELYLLIVWEQFKFQTVCTYLLILLLLCNTFCTL
jgi:hypothetical protein